MPGTPPVCPKCGSSCKLKFATVEFYYHEESKSLPVDLRDDGIWYCRACASLRQVLYLLWEFLRKRPEYAGLPKKWSVAVVRWMNGRTQVVWG